MKTGVRASAGAALMLLSAVVLAGCGNGNLIHYVTHPGSLGLCGIIYAVMGVLALLDVAGSRRSTGDKVLWAIIIIIFPLVGSLLYYFIGRR